VSADRRHLRGRAAQSRPDDHWRYFLLATALLIALGFEFVNGFHDTANAVATVIYTHSLPPNYRRGLVGHVQPSSAC
jgi:PiT family inorganic phosphate transporter